MPRVLPDVLLRAPASRPGTLDDLAIAIGTPSLAAGLERGDPGAAAARARLERRAGFRPTPHALYAGVALGQLGDTTALDLGEPVAWITVAYARLVRLGRALLGDPGFRPGVTLSPHPSLLRSGSRILWLHGDEPREANRDLLDACPRSALWVARAPHRRGLSSPSSTTAARYDLVRRASSRAAAWFAVGRSAGQGVAPCSSFSGAADRRGPRRPRRAPPRRSQRTASSPFRARRAPSPAPPPCAPPRFARSCPRCAALTPPSPAHLDSSAPITAITDQRERRAAPGRVALVTRLRVATRPPHRPRSPSWPPSRADLRRRARAGSRSLDDLAVPPRGPPRPGAFLTPTAIRRPRLVLAPCSAAPLGRFAHALGKPMLRALRALAAAEPDDRVDVAYAPSDALADLTAHPPIRRHALGLTTAADLAPADLSLDADELAVHGFSVEGTAVVPSPLARLRSTTAPPGVYRQLLAWSLERQHAPWGLVPAPLFALPWLPRLTLGGFVVSPQSWRVLPGPAPRCEPLPPSCKSARRTSSPRRPRRSAS